MKVADWMSPDPVTVSPETTVREARRLMSYYGIRHLPVVERDRVVGVVSDRDVRVDAAPLGEIAAVDEVHGVLRVAERVASVMCSPAWTISAEEDIGAAARLMLSRRISALPVLDHHGALRGVITTTDCLLASMTPRPVSS